jgi:hypothetical protein
MRWLRQFVLRNAGMKLLALAISFFLWSTYTAEPFAEVGYNVPIAFVNVPAGLAISGDAPNAARVLVRGRAGLLRQLVPSDLSLSVNLSAATPGDTAIQLTPAMVEVPYGTEVVRVTPSGFRVSLVPTSIPAPRTE